MSTLTYKGITIKVNSKNEYFEHYYDSVGAEHMIGPFSSLTDVKKDIDSFRKDE
jgi:hypothetical protein